jgi:DNA-binding response OmpR family regulator
MAESILVVEDESSIQEIVSLYLKRAGYQVLAVSDGAAALLSLEKTLPDLVVLDLMLPRVDGFEITRWLRAKGETPIIMLTARRGEADRIAGLEMGADDYLVKPFSPQELVSRVRAVLRRVHNAASESSKEGERPLVFNDLTIDPQTRSVVAQGQPHDLTSKEFDLLYLLAAHPRQVFSRDQLLDKIWGVSDYIDPGTVTVHMRRIREKIEQDPATPRHLTTVWGVGYRFEP